MRNRIVLPAALAFLVALAAPLSAGEQSARLSVPGMFCASCPYIVEAAARDVEGVLAVTANSDLREAEILYDDAVTGVAAIRAALRNAGYDSTLIEGEG